MRRFDYEIRGRYDAAIERPFDIFDIYFLMSFAPEPYFRHYFLRLAPRHASAAACHFDYAILRHFRHIA
jgi:hypothetical protein